MGYFALFCDFDGTLVHPGTPQTTEQKKIVEQVQENLGKGHWIVTEDEVDRVDQDSYGANHNIFGGMGAVSRMIYANYMDDEPVRTPSKHIVEGLQPCDKVKEIVKALIKNELEDNNGEAVFKIQDKTYAPFSVKSIA